MPQGRGDQSTPPSDAESSRPSSTSTFQDASAGFWFQHRQPSKRYVRGPGVGLLAMLLVVIGVLVMVNIVGVWPSSVPPSVASVMEEAADTLTVPQLRALADSVRTQATMADTVTVYAVFTIIEVGDVSWDFRLLLISLWFGALGSLLHAAASFVEFAGNRTLVSSWLPWYVVRPVIGAGLAAVFYVVVRAGLVTTGGIPLADVSHFPIAASAALVGLFTQRATKKLADVFDALFTPREGAAETDPLTDTAGSEVPRITSLSPEILQAGDSETTVLVQAEGLTRDVVLRVNGEDTPFERRAEGRLAFSPKPEAVATKGTMEITLHTGAGVSRPRRLVVAP